MGYMADASVTLILE